MKIKEDNSFLTHMSHDDLISYAETARTLLISTISGSGHNDTKENIDRIRAFLGVEKPIASHGEKKLRDDVINDEWRMFDVATFKELEEAGMFTPYDGEGSYANKELGLYWYDTNVFYNEPSDYPDIDITHVYWSNK